MIEKTNLICITCPKGCTLEVTRDGDTIVKVDAGCKRGNHYAEEELHDPRRMIASTVRIQGGRHPLLPVYTRTPFPKPRISDLLEALRSVEISTPVHMGDVVLADALGTGVDIVASRDMG
jgi:CxxC motif-containing protein